jgi:predicted O-linked N-acetylglucosamine transferase (SPINDLY family)
MTEFPLQEVLKDAVRLHQAGRLGEAEARYRSILAARPGHVESMQRLGILLHQSGRSAEAIEWLTTAVDLSPNSADCHANVGAVQASQGLLTQAVQSFETAAKLRPDVPQLHFNLANALRQSGLLEEAEKAYRTALSLRADWPEACNNLGAVLADLNQIEPAIRAFRRAVELRPTWAEAHNNLAVALHRSGDVEAAIASYRQAVALSPSDANLHNNLSAALQQTGALEEALSEVQVALSLKPSDPPTLVNVGNALRNLGRSHEAVQAYETAISLRPDYPDAHYNLGSAQRDVQRLDDAVASFNRAIALRPTYGEAFANLAAVLRDKGELDDSIATYRKAADLTSLPWIAGNLLYTLHFHPDFDARRIYQEHVQWNERYAKATETAAFARGISVHDAAEDRRLRIGYLSCDFRNHPVGRFIQPLLAQHDAEKFETYCYSDTLRPDAFSDELRSHVDVWRNTLGLSDEKLSDLIRRDRIDILVDLSLHARKGRLMALATKPAPVQVTYLAYCSTSGLRTMDYRLSDPYLDPPGSDLSVYFEKTIRLNCYWCYPGAPYDLPVAPPPSLSTARITFGCLNVFAKVTQLTLLNWFQILRRIPDSRLLIHALEGSHRDRVRTMAAAQNVDPERVDFLGFLPGQRYFQAYNDIDIALDPFPYAGGTTTCDALWMGVPVISLSGATAVSRGGSSILSAIGLAHLAAAHPSHYADLAVDIANDQKEREILRNTLRQKMTSSPLMNATGFTRNVEAGYVQMWNDLKPRRLPT